ncbi:DUF2695 domain-containing protein [Pelomonas parva]|uniref:DUF2695 domain-containing protein n=1 Tax=Pelomonas parva TaxID=3299032 RepID=A0ABW7F9I8_9BURK
MTSSTPTDKKARLKEWRLQQRALARSNFPLADDRLQHFFHRLDQILETASCTHSLTHAAAATADMGLTEDESEALFDWCEENGGYCDCEIAANTRQHWEQVRSST